MENMPTPSSRPVPTGVAGPGGHEPSDVRLRVPVVSIIVLTVVMAALMFMLRGLLAMLGEASTATAAGPSGPTLIMPAAEAHPQPPNPRLEVVSDATIKAVRAHEQYEMTHGAWIDRQRGLVRIPIDQAIEQVVAGGHGVPASLPATRPDVIDPHYAPPTTQQPQNPGELQ